MTGLLTRFFEQRGISATTDPTNPAYWLVNMFGGREAASGIRVTTETALGWTPFAAGVRIIAETMGSLPCQTFERLEPRGRELRRNHPLYFVLHDQANEEMTAFEFFELMQTHIPLFGFAAAQIIYNGRGDVIELWPLNPDRVTITRNPERQLQFRVTLPQSDQGGVSGSAALPADEVLLIRGWGGGIIGRAIPTLFKESLGLGLATEIFAGAFFGRGAVASGVLEHPGELGDEAHERLRKAVENQVAGIDKQHRLLILEEGMKWHQTTIEPEKAQLLGLREFQVSEASRMLRIPAHKLGDLKRATFSNIEHQAIEFVEDTIRPYAVRWEQRMAMQLLGRKDRARVFLKFNLDAILRGDLESRYRAYLTGRQAGLLSANDAREKEDMNPRTDPGGDTYADLPAGVPANTTPPTQPTRPAGGIDAEEEE